MLYPVVASVYHLSKTYRRRQIGEKRTLHHVTEAWKVRFSNINEKNLRVVFPFIVNSSCGWFPIDSEQRKEDQTNHVSDSSSFWNEFLLFGAKWKQLDLKRKCLQTFTFVGGGIAFLAWRICVVVLAMPNV